jgi:hypothetical protein
MATKKKAVKKTVKKAVKAVKKTAKAVKKTAKRKCSECGELGHNVRSHGPGSASI